MNAELADDLDRDVAVLNTEPVERRSGGADQILLRGAGFDTLLDDQLDLEGIAAHTSRSSSPVPRRRGFLRDLRCCSSSSVCSAYAETMCWTSLWRTTSVSSKRTKPMSSMSLRICPTSIRPELSPRGKSICVMSPVTPICEP